MSSERRAARRYLAFAAFAALFAGVYELFSHGVVSAFMVGLPLWPLLLGALPFAVLDRARVSAGQTARCLYHAGLAALTLGSLLTGVFEIYGSMSALVAGYWLVGGALAAAGVGRFAWDEIRRKKAQSTGRFQGA